ncbi:hypothetical protein IGI04_037511, partial [Brassica rapa subsp. trilocularis]
MLSLAKCLFCSLRNHLAFELDFLYTGRLFFNGTSGTHIYFDSESLRQMQAKNAIHNGSNQTSSSSKLIHAQKLDALTISELNQYVLSADPQ